MLCVEWIFESFVRMTVFQSLSKCFRIRQRLEVQWFVKLRHGESESWVCGMNSGCIHCKHGAWELWGHCECADEVRSLVNVWVVRWWTVRGSECIWANTEYIHAPLFGIILLLSAQIRKQNWQSDYYLEAGLLKTLGTCTRSWRRIFVSFSTIFRTMFSTGRLDIDVCGTQATRVFPMYPSIWNTKCLNNNACKGPESPTTRKYEFCWVLWHF